MGATSKWTPHLPPDAYTEQAKLAGGRVRPGTFRPQWRRSSRPSPRTTLYLIGPILGNGKRQFSVCGVKSERAQNSFRVATGSMICTTLRVASQ